MSLHSLRHVLHGAVDRRVFDLEPVVGVPADQEPHVLLPVELLLEHLQHEGGGVHSRWVDEERRAKQGICFRHSIPANWQTDSTAGVQVSGETVLTSQKTFLASVS